MQSVEHLVWQEQIKENSRNALRERVRFEEYQADFNFTDTELKTCSFLDVGAGDGAFIHFLQEEKGNDHVYALDTEKPATTTPHFSVGSIVKIPYGDKLFDKVLSRNVMHSLMLQANDTLIPQAISELTRVTKEEGRVLYSMHNPSILTQRIMNSPELSPEQKERSLERLTAGTKKEKDYLEYLESLGHAIQTTFQNNRKVVSITLRAVQ